MALQRLRLDLAYDGAAYHGWAVQPGLATVQGTIEQAFAKLLRMADPPRLTVAGRTDAGVHARHQVAHVDLLVEQVAGEQLIAAGSTSELAAVSAGGGGWAVTDLARRLGAILPPDIRIHQVTVAPDGFDARFSALWRHYVYRLADCLTGRDPLQRGQVLWLNQPLDLAAMNQAASSILGEQDFIAFCKPREGATTIRRLLQLRATRRPDTVIEVAARADAFCHNMVRALVGALVAVGTGRRPVAWLCQALAEGRANASRAIGGNVLPAHGLTLEQIAYPSEDQLASRASASRQLRQGSILPSLTQHF
ncbi:MAG: tRNA pseudouridine(38-40) synthase TruA [Bifidobacteriaceae bacterium]|nr:tRNA pseudouridine(38-40) synthase TruA [Bifidobacteriaceae bacterium]